MFGPLALQCSNAWMKRPVFCRFFVADMSAVVLEMMLLPLAGSCCRVSCFGYLCPKVFDWGCWVSLLVHFIEVAGQVLCCDYSIFGVKVIEDGERGHKGIPKLLVF
jgi:hypothetical protein